MDIANEVDGLIKFLRRLENGQLVLTQNKVDVTQREIKILKEEIAHLQAVLARKTNV